VGGDFIGWSNDGRSAYYSIGRSFFRYEVSRADSLVADSTVKARAQAAAPAKPDSAAASAAPKPALAYEASRVDVEIVARKDRPAGTVVLRGARIITMKGDEVIPAGDVVVTDNRIAAVGATGSVTAPAGARVIDVAGKTIIPGLVDIHAHTWVAWGLHRNQVSQFLAQLAYGVTTQRDPQTSSEDIVTYADLMETGDLIGPRLYSTGPGVFSSDNIRSLDEARDVLRRYSEHFNTKTIKQYMAGDRKVRQWVITAARELGLTTTTEGGANFTMNLTLMQDGYPGLEHSLPISPFYRDVVELENWSGITYTPTLIVSYGGPIGRDYYLSRTNVDSVSRLRRFTPHDELDKWKNVQYYRDDQYVFPLHAEQLTKLVNAGGRVGLGSHGEVQGLGTHWELWMMASGGMRPHDALRMATLHSADAIGLARDIGSIEPGKLADLQVLDRNPLEQIEHTNSIRYVMKNGRLYDAATLDEVWPRQRKLPAQWWWRLEPQ
jgi:imidazolonepropionase-like amidohydrolase